MTFAPDPARIDAIRPGVGLCILNSEGHLLLHRRRACGRWAPPSGRMEVGETISEAAVREAAEETGLRVRIMRVIGIYSDPLFQVVPEAGGFTQYVTTVLRCGVDEGTLAGSSEGLEWRWFPLDALPTEMTPYGTIWIADLRADHPVFLR